MTCKDCIHGVICNVLSSPNSQDEKNAEKWCWNFKNKADFVEVVRCKDCKFYKPIAIGLENACIRQSAYKEPTDYCSMGEPKNDKE